MTRFKIYRDATGGYRWRLLASHGQAMAICGEGFVSALAARSGIEAVKRDAPDARIVDLTEEGDTMSVPPPRYPISVMPVQSGHGDVHDVIVCRSNGDSITIDDYRWIFSQIAGREIEDREIPIDWFAEEDR